MRLPCACAVRQHRENVQKNTGQKNPGDAVLEMISYRVPGLSMRRLRQGNQLLTQRLGRAGRAGGKIAFYPIVSFPPDPIEKNIFY